MPLVVSLVRQRRAFLRSEFWDVLKVLAVPCDKRCSAKEFRILGEVVVLGKLLSIMDDLLLAVSLRVSAHSQACEDLGLTLSGFWITFTAD